MKIFTFKSNPPLTPFAPQWDYSLGHENISNFIDCPKIASLILSKEKSIIGKFPDDALKGPAVNSSSIDGYTITQLGQSFSTYSLKIQPLINYFRKENICYFN